MGKSGKLNKSSQSNKSERETVVLQCSLPKLNKSEKRINKHIRKLKTHKNDHLKTNRGAS